MAWKRPSRMGQANLLMTEKHIDARRHWCEQCPSRGGCASFVKIEDSNVSCPLDRPKWRGVPLLRSIASGQLGDAVSAITHAVGIEECGGCSKRRRRMNRGH